MDSAPPTPPAIVAPAPAAAAPAAPPVVVATPSAESELPPPPSFATAAGGDIYPRSPEEKRLCEKASQPDWLYLGAGVASIVGSVFLDSRVKYANSPGQRLLGPAAVGLSWGFTLGAIYPSLPKCDPRWVGESPREGGVSRSWPVAAAIAVLAGVTAPLFMGVEQGYGYAPGVRVFERQMRVVLSSSLGVGGSLLPYLLPPKTWRAAKKLEGLRAEPYQDGAMLKYVVRF